MAGTSRCTEDISETFISRFKIRGKVAQQVICKRYLSQR